MKKPVVVVTHERSGTHLLINMINYKNKGDFLSFGKLPNNIPHNVDVYKGYVYRYVLASRYEENVVMKSHHQVGFFDDCLDYLLDNYKVIYLKREIKDTLLSYYRFLNSDENHKPIVGFPEFKDWIFMNPQEVGYKYFADYPDPHVIIEPVNYIDRILIHHNGWMKLKDKVMILDYEDILTDFNNTKERIESYIGDKISDSIPDIKDKSLPNFYPNKGIIGAHKEFMDDSIINKIDDFICQSSNKYLP